MNVSLFCGYFRILMISSMNIVDFVKYNWFMRQMLILIRFECWTSLKVKFETDQCSEISCLGAAL